MAAKLLPVTHKDDFKNFDPVLYLNMRYQKTTDYFRFTFPLQKYHDFFAKLCVDCDKKLKILDYGCGPVIMYLISVAPLAEEIVMADKVPRCLDEVKRWIDGDRKAFDWTAHFDHVVQNLECKGEREAKEREKELRLKIRGIVWCDIFEDNPIEAGYEGPYDIVMSNMCIDGVCRTPQEFEVAVGKLAHLVRPGGKFTAITNSYPTLGKCCTYGVGDEAVNSKFPSVSITREFLQCSLANAGFVDIHIDECEQSFKDAISSGSVGPWALHQPDDFLGFLFAYATKKL